MNMQNLRCVSVIYVMVFFLNVLLIMCENEYGSSARSEPSNFNKNVKAADSGGLYYGVKTHIIVRRIQLVSATHMKLSG